MTVRSMLLAVIASGMLLAGCGGPPPPPMDRELYDKVMMQQFDLQAKGRTTKADVDKLYAKNNVNPEVMTEAIKLWGEPEAVTKKRLALIEKMTVGAK